MKIAPARIEAFLDRPDAGIVAVLVYGPDAGLVHERARRLARSVAGSPDDPFRVADVAPETLRSDPARLADEVASVALTGGRRVVRVREATDSLADLFARLFEAPPCAPDQAALVVAEAGELGPRSSLRQAFEAAETAVALPCYLDEGTHLAQFIRRTLGEDGVSASPEALEYLIENLGADRALTRRELEKLALYAGPGGRVEIEDAVASVGDAAARSIEDVAFAAGGGELDALDRALDRVFLEGATPVGVLRAAARHFQRLHLAGSGLAAGETAEAAMARLKPQVFFKDRGRFRSQVEKWPPKRAARALDRLLAAESQCKTTGMPDAAICRHVLLELAAQARQGRSSEAGD